MDFGIVSLAGFGMAIIATVSVLVLGFRAISEIPRPGNEHPELEPRRIVRAAVFSLVSIVGYLIGIIAGIVWIVQAFTS